ncbi:LuxR C-terminal-related transcriptional regulator [Bradyrhizobium cajani]|uniref:DNA-binding response regulator n=1 Tax=Bradyrhizobium cajani TaxID=1928661 RepID=A0A844T794_9BRAD|nr:response regulator transcription factor [Bradyrhizobium cajani]MCP3369505.1 response regulator transcription factor [Bradyrhizobium cajani]MVT71914.1 DNA-binding response regulator [Bradyrhizobium cajani]
MRRRQSAKVVLIGRNILVREGISRILREADFHIAMSASSADELPSALQGCKLLFVIVHNPDEFDLAVKHIGFVREHYPAARVAIVSDHYRPHEMISAYKAGASGYFVDVNSCDAFVKSIELVTMGETVFPPAFLSFVLDGSSDREPQLQPTGEERSSLIVTAEERIAPHLSPREQAILSFLIEGNSNKSIARKIDIAEATVKVHVKAILRKIRVQNRTQAAIWGMNNGSLVRPSNGHVLSLSIDRTTAPGLAPHEPGRHEAGVSEME